MCAININTDIETTVVIEWERVQPWQKYAEKNTQNDSGIYQITGNHVVFGDNSLLYIGKAVGQTFSQRIEQHREWLNNEWGVKIYIGRIRWIEGEDMDSDANNVHGNRWINIVDLTEPLLIYFHSPPYNSNHIQQITIPVNETLRLINIGNCGELYPEVSHQGLSIYDRGPRPIDP